MDWSGIENRETRDVFKTFDLLAELKLKNVRDILLKILGDDVLSFDISGIAEELHNLMVDKKLTSAQIAMIAMALTFTTVPTAVIDNKEIVQAMIGAKHEVA